MYIPRFKLYSKEALSATLDSLSTNTVGLIGCGVMGTELSDSLPKAFTQVGYDPFNQTAKNVKFLSSMEAVLQYPGLTDALLVTKPQEFMKRQKQYNILLKNTNATVASGMAALGSDDVNADIFFMPNRLVEQGECIIFAWARPTVSEEKRLAFSAMWHQKGNQVVWVRDEKDMHLGVAASGSAPMYGIFMIEKALAATYKPALSELLNTVSLVSDHILQSKDAMLDYTLSLSLGAEDRASHLRLARGAFGYHHALLSLGLPVPYANLVSGHTLRGVVKRIGTSLELCGSFDFEGTNKGIMSPGGTTRAGMDVFLAEKDLQASLDTQETANDCLTRVVFAVRDRSIEMPAVIKAEIAQSAVASGSLGVFSGSKHGGSNDATPQARFEL